jgi:hypothetical protein
MGSLAIVGVCLALLAAAFFALRGGDALFSRFSPGAGTYFSFRTEKIRQPLEYPLSALTLQATRLSHWA